MTTVIQDRDLCRVRLRLVDLFKSFFAEEPDAEKLARWRGIFAALAGARVSRDFDRGKARITDLLWTKNLIELQHQYRQLSTSPHGGQPPPTLATFSRHDRHGRDRLAEIRIIMAEAGLVRVPAAPAAADNLMVPLDTLAALIEMEKEAGKAARELAARLARRLLVPLAENLRTALKGGGHADFYLHCGRLLGSYLELELALIDEGQASEAGGARRAFARLFAATALLTGAAMTARTVCRTTAAPERPRDRRRSAARSVFAPLAVRRRPTRTPAEAQSEDCGVAAAFLRQAVGEQAMAS